MSTYDKVLEIGRTCLLLTFLYFVFNDLSAERFFEHVIFEWQWGRFVTIALAYFLVREFMRVASRQGVPPLWRCMLWTSYAVGVLTILIWAGYGTHTEDADPLFGGGTAVTDFVPSETEKDLMGSRLFVDMLIPVLLAVYIGYRSVRIS